MTYSWVKTPHMRSSRKIRQLTGSMPAKKVQAGVAVKYGGIMKFQQIDNHPEISSDGGGIMT